MDINELLPRSDDAKFLHVPYATRWECLKPVIKELYLGKYGPNGKSMTGAQRAAFMRAHYSFHAAESEYPRWFKKWGIRRRIRDSEKEDVTAALAKRTHPETSTSDVTLGHDKAVDKKQMKRYLKDQIRHYKAEPMWPGVLSSWNLPYAAYSKALGKRPDQPSPFGNAASTPAYLNIESPEPVTPGRPAAAPSPAMQLVRQKAARDRSSLFLQGRHLELLAGCGKEDRVTLVNYLHDFYIYSFVVAKYWGRGPRMGQWTAGLVSALTLGSFDIASPASLPSAMSPAAASDWPDRLDAPTQLCRWSIHVRSVAYEDIPDPIVDMQDGFDIQDPHSWTEWPVDEREHSSASFAALMQESISNSTFSLTPTGDLPISTEVISQSVQQDPEMLQVDVWKVAIMAGNVDLLRNLENNDGVPGRIHEIFPLHLAASFLDGGQTCCSMIVSLCETFGPGYLLRRNHDDLGHTVLDTLMITVLRSHTTVSPEHVSSRFNPPHRFPGEEKDICGRWDADSPAVRALFRRGYSRVPIDWKHAFCHTGAQAICHSIIAVVGTSASLVINTPSGLFVRRCSNCGLELKLGPLHTLVVVAFYLAHRGMPSETMFGALAILVCLLRLGADVSFGTDMSVEDILGRTEPGRCYHKHMDACNLMQTVPDDLVTQWSSDCQTGWICILQVLLLAKRDKDRKSQRDQDSEHESESGNSDGDSDLDSEGDYTHDQQIHDCGLEKDDMPVHTEWLYLPCGNPKLGLLWATIQVELLTYRRINIGDCWVSGRFSMGALRTWLEGRSLEFRTPLVERGMMQHHSPCGWFPCPDFVCPVAEEVCKGHYMNMDVYDRVAFLHRPEMTNSWLETYCGVGM